MIVPIVGGPLPMMVTSQCSHIYLLLAAWVLKLLRYSSCLLPFALVSVTWFHYWDLWSPVAFRMGLDSESETLPLPLAMWGIFIPPCSLCWDVFFPKTMSTRLSWKWGGHGKFLTFCAVLEDCDAAMLPSCLLSLYLYLFSLGSWTFKGSMG